MAASNESRERWSQFEPRPNLILTSAQAGWSGAEFHEIVSPRFGSFEGGGDARSITLSWTLGPLRVRYGVNRLFQEVARRPVVYMGGEQQAGEWAGVETSLLVYLPGPFIDQTLGFSAHLARPKLIDQQLTKMEHFTQLIRADVRAGSPAGFAVGETLFAWLLNVIFPDDERARTIQQERGSKVIARMLEYIEANLGEPLSLLQIATQAGMSARHMSRAFKAVTGYAPHDYIVRRRVSKATELVRDGHLGLADIAIAVGFSSHAHMSAAFRRVSGQVPSLFRNS
jgi:AraC-like DNA-binding protein